MGIKYVIPFNILDGIDVESVLGVWSVEKQDCFSLEQFNFEKVELARSA